MKQFKIPPSNSFYWVSQVIAGLLICCFGQVHAHNGCEFIPLGGAMGCNGATVSVGGNDNLPANFWDFGDGTPILSGGPGFNFVDHEYTGDINPFATPAPKIRHSQDGTNWCEQNLSDFLPAILIGNGCGSQRTLSTLISNNKLPSNELVGKTLYLFCNLDIDIAYKFTGCLIFVSNGCKIRVKPGGALTINNNTILEANYIPGDANCGSLWGGLEVEAGGSITTDGATIRDAYFGIRIVNPSNINPIPKLSLKNTTFHRNFVGIHAASGSFIISNFINNIFKGNGDIPIYPASTCNIPGPIVSGAPFSKRTYCGIYFDGFLGGKLLLASQSVNNLFIDLQSGIVCVNGTSFIQQCRFENIRFLQSTPAFLAGIAVSFIDAVGGKQFVLTGLGKEAAPTITNCEQGVFIYTTNQATSASVSQCRMEEVQNGVEFLEGTGLGVLGNFSRGTVMNCYIGCTKYFGNIKKRSTGIEFKDPNIAYSNINIGNNTIDVDQPGAFSPTVIPNILPSGITIMAMHNQASNGGMLLNISFNKVNLIAGVNGITVENVVNANISNNEIVKTKESQEVYRCISVVGGLNNSITCNVATNIPQGGPVGVPVGIICESSLNTQISQNTIKDMASCLALRFDNAEDCVISYNNFENSDPTIIQGTGIYYFDAITGPQYLQSNYWLGDFAFGGFYEHGPQGFPYCDSRYQVSLGANVANSTNPVVSTLIEPCGNWFSVDGTEYRYICGVAPDDDGTLAKNEADLNLASGGTFSLSPGYKWSSDMNLIRKFTENPTLAAGDAIINGFLQAQQSQPVAAFYGVRNSINAIEGSASPALLSNIQNTIAQLESNEADLLALLESIDSDPNALVSFTTLSAECDVLDQTLQNYLAAALSSMMLSAVAVYNNNNSISSPTLPCDSERKINGLYLETQIISPRTLTAAELEDIRQIGLNCSKDASSVVYLARAWYYLQTGTMLNPPCGSFAPNMEGGERINQLQSELVKELVLTPNPTNGSVTIIPPADLGEYTLIITDMSGRLLFQRMILESESDRVLTIPTENIIDGIYLVSVKANLGTPHTKRLVIIH